MKLIANGNRKKKMRQGSASIPNLKAKPISDSSERTTSTASSSSSTLTVEPSSGSSSFDLTNNIRKSSSSCIDCVSEPFQLDPPTRNPQQVQPRRRASIQFGDTEFMVYSSPTPTKSTACVSMEDTPVAPSPDLESTTRSRKKDKTKKKKSKQRRSSIATTTQSPSQASHTLYGDIEPWKLFGYSEPGSAPVIGNFSDERVNTTSSQHSYDVGDKQMSNKNPRNSDPAATTQYGDEEPWKLFGYSDPSAVPNEASLLLEKTPKSGQFEEGESSQSSLMDTDIWSPPASLSRDDKASNGNIDKGPDDKETSAPENCPLRRHHSSSSPATNMQRPPLSLRRHHSTSETSTARPPPARRGVPRKSSMKQKGAPARPRAASIGDTVEVFLPEEGRMIRRRTSISFDETTQVKKVQPARELAEDPESLYLKKEDFRRIKLKIEKVSSGGGGGLLMKKQHCTRGIERFVGNAEGLRESIARKSEARGLVLDMQDLQRDTGEWNDEHIAAVYRQTTVDPQREANARAQKDAAEVKRYMAPTRRLCRRISM